MSLYHKRGGKCTFMQEVVFVIVIVIVEGALDARSINSTIYLCLLLR